VEKNPLAVFVGTPIIEGEDIQVTIDCGSLIQSVTNESGLISSITWYKNGRTLSNGSATNVILSQDNQLLILTETALSSGGQLGTNGDYTCEVCSNTTDCLNETSIHIVCSEYDLSLVCYQNLLFFLDKPNFLPPIFPIIISSSVIALTCGQDVTVPSFEGVLSLSISCRIYNGSDFTSQVFKDGVITEYSNFQVDISNPGDNVYGTYTFLASTVYCGSTRTVSRVLRQGQYL